MALTPEQIAEIQRLKALMQPAANEAQRKAQAQWNAEQMAKRQGKAKGGLAKFLSDSVVKNRVYHGTESKDDYDDDNQGNDAIKSFAGRATWVAEEPYTAHGYSGKSGYVMPLHVKLKKPLKIDHVDANDEAHHIYGLAKGIGVDVDHLKSMSDPESVWEVINHPYFIDAASNAGFDGISIKEGGRKTHAIFNPAHIKSAIGNRGTYDTTKADITKAKGGQISQDAMQLALMNKKVPVVSKPKKTVKAYKMFRVDPKRPGQLFPLFVDADTPVPMNQWVDAIEGAMANGKVKSKIGPLAYRPGWHAGDLPLATHIGDKDEEQKAEVARIQAMRQAMLTDIGDDAEAKKIVNKMYPYPEWVNAPRLRNPRHIWAEIEMPHDVDWQTEATKRGTNEEGKFIANRAHITDQLPKGGHYRYKTNANMTGNWLIGGAMKVNKILSDAEVEAINKAAGAADLPRAKPMKKEKFGFADGGTVAPEEWMAEEHVNHKAKGGSVLKELEAHLKQREGDYGVKRLQRAADEIPNLESMYTLQALKEAFGGDNAKALMTMNPADFERFAVRLFSDPDTREEEMEERIERGHGLPPMSHHDYIEHLAKIKGGFADVPFLEVNKRPEYLPNISGHEGRHRSRAMAVKGAQKSLVRLLPSPSMRESMPRRYREDFIEAMKKELGEKRLVTGEGRSLLPADLEAPEHKNIERRNMLGGRPQLPEIYKDGGKVTHAHQLDIEERPL